MRSARTSRMPLARAGCVVPVSSTKGVVTSVNVMVRPAELTASTRVSRQRPMSGNVDASAGTGASPTAGTSAKTGTSGRAGTSSGVGTSVGAGRSLVTGASVAGGASTAGPASGPDGASAEGPASPATSASPEGTAASVTAGASAAPPASPVAVVSVMVDPQPSARHGSSTARTRMDSMVHGPVAGEAKCNNVTMSPGAWRGGRRPCARAADRAAGAGTPAAR